MTITMHSLGWYVAVGKVDGIVLIVGFGKTHAEALCDAMRDYQVVCKCRKFK